MKDRNSVPDIKKDIDYIEELQTLLKQGDTEFVNDMLNDWKAELLKLKQDRSEL
jgi:hypothetical protein